MGYSKEQRQAKLSEKENDTEIKIETKSIQKSKLKLDDNVSIVVSSNVFGLLTYVNHKTGDKYQWMKNGDTQILYVSDIRAMKSNQIRFLQENWILIDGIADSNSNFDEVTSDEIYEALQISQYYTDRLCPKNIGDIFNWDASEIRQKVPKMNQTVKESLIVRANELIKAGVLDSISKVKALETVLSCELTSPDEDE